jgi:hypothetical protein
LSWSARHSPFAAFDIEAAILTIKDYRWNSTAQGWALGGKKDQKMAQWLEDAERQREQGPR